MGDSIEQYRGAVGSHFVFLKFMEYRKCFKSTFWCTMVLIFYKGTIYLPVLKAAVHNYAHESSMTDTNVSLSVLHP